MRYRVILPQNLTDKEIMLWHQFQKDNIVLQSPYFCIEFIKAVSRINDKVFVTVIESSDHIIGFFPFQKNSFGIGQPVGGALSDIHGIVTRPTTKINMRELIKNSKISRWKFNFLPLYSGQFDQHVETQMESFSMDISKGFSQYCDDLGKRGSKVIKDCHYKARKLQKNYGKIEFDPDVRDPSVLELLFEWKSKQYKDSGLIDVFSFQWTRDLIKELFATRSDSFSGMLSVLYNDGKPIAIHFGMRSSWAWNWWFPRHDTNYNNCSPGILLRLFVAEYAANIGLHRIDLGVGGPDSYKPRLGNCTIKLGQGLIQNPTMVNGLINGYKNIESTVRGTWVEKYIKTPGRYIKSIERMMRYK